MPITIYVQQGVITKLFRAIVAQSDVVLHVTKDDIANEQAAMKAADDWCKEHGFVIAQSKLYRVREPE